MACELRRQMMTGQNREPVGVGPGNGGKPLSRRAFMGKLVIGGGSLVLLAGCGLSTGEMTGKGGRGRVYEFIAVDYTKCTGCRTCEAVCAAFNAPMGKNGCGKSDVGNPHGAAIRVHSFNPDVTVPVACTRCPDSPCVAACPVEAHPTTGHRALFVGDKYGAVTQDSERCIGCGECVAACEQASVGILARNPETGGPMRMCTFCDGDPQCVAHCPYEAISVLRVGMGDEFYRMPPAQVAEIFNTRWYTLD